MCLEGKKLNKALKMSRKAVELEPDNASYLDTIGWILHLKGKDQDAKTYFKRAMIYGGKDSYECVNHYAQVLEALKETDLSRYYYDLARQLQDESEE
jgi:tetratricopeptide (TPR) repeat protein